MTCGSGLDVPDMFPSIKSAGRRFAFLHGVLRGEFPSFIGTIKALRLPAARLAALRLLRLAIPRLHSRFRSPTVECAARAWSWSPGVSGRETAEERAGSPKFLGNLDSSVCHVPNRRRRDCLRQTIAAQQRGPWSSQGKGSHDWDFRRSIAWPSDSLRAPSASLVGFAGPVARRHARLASSCWSGSPGRGSHPRGSDERFQITSHPPFPALLGANDASTVGSPAPSPLGRMVAITGDVKPSTHLAYRLNFGFRIEEHVLRVPAVGEIELNPFRTEMYIE